MRKILLLLMALGLIFSLAACPKGGDEASDAGTGLDQEVPESTSAPASEISTDNAEQEADAILKDLDNL